MSPRKQLVIPFPMFPEPFLHFWILKLKLSHHHCLLIHLSHLKTLRVPLRQGRGQTYLYGPAFSTAAGTEMPELLLPLAKCPCHTPELHAGLFLCRQPLLRELGSGCSHWQSLKPCRKLTMGPLTQLNWALSGKTRSLPQHLSLKPAFLPLWGNTEPVFIKKQEQGHKAGRASQAEQSDFWEDGSWGGKVERAFHQQSCWHSGSVNSPHRGREGGGGKIKEYKQ